MVRLRLVIFDVDGTLIRVHSSWQFLHEALGTWDKGRKYAQQFFNGSISYEDWARLDASLWKGYSLDRIKQIVYGIPYVEGVREAINSLRENNFKVVLLSAGLSLVTERIRAEMGVDYALANKLLIRDGYLTGEVKVNVSFHDKHKVLHKILTKFNIEMEECAAVGDDETVIPLFERVGLAIAFNPRKETVERHADVVVRSNDLRDILPHLVGKQRLS